MHSTSSPLVSVRAGSFLRSRFEGPVARETPMAHLVHLRLAARRGVAPSGHSLSFHGDGSGPGFFLYCAKRWKLERGLEPCVPNPQISMLTSAYIQMSI